MADITVGEALERLRQVVGTDRPIGLHEPTLGGNAEAYVRDTVVSGWVSSAGSYVDRFEQMLTEITGCHAVACVNGTSGLQAALVASGLQPGREVVMPSLTFVASSNAVMHAGAHPSFCDVDPDTLALSEPLVREHISRAYAPDPSGVLVNRVSGRELGAIMIVHVFGNPAEVEPVRDLAAELDVPLVEDAAEALGSWDEFGLHCGSYGRTGVLSFNGNKIVTTGGGGAVITADPDLARRVKHLTTTAKLPHSWEFEHDEVAWNYRLPNLNAALGCAQLEELEGLLKRKAALADRYADVMADLGGVELVRARAGTRPNNWLTAIKFADRSVQQAFLAASNAEGIQTRPLWQPMHRLPMYRSAHRGPLPATELLCDTVVNLPSSAHLA